METGGQAVVSSCQMWVKSRNERNPASGENTETAGENRGRGIVSQQPYLGWHTYHNATGQGSNG